jgi:glutaredoxin
MRSQLESSPPLTKLLELAGGEPGAVRLVLRAGATHTPLAARLLAAGESVRQATDGAVSLSRDTTGNAPGRPALTVVSRDRGRVHYLAVPEGPEEGPFVDGLIALAGGPPADAATTELVLDRPAEVLVFIAPSCPNCPRAVRAAFELAVASPAVTLAVIDATEFASLAARLGVRSVPTTVIDRELSVVGVVPSPRLATMLLERALPTHDGAVLGSMVRAGRFTDAAGLLVAGRGRPRFAAMWRGSSLEERIGLVLTAEEALGRDETVLDELVPDLVGTLGDRDPARRGDTADLLGAIGHPAARSALEDLLEDPDPDVADAAADALESIARRRVIP